MAELLILDIDDAVIERLEARANAEGVSLDTIIARILQRDVSMPDDHHAAADLAAELAAMRATQPRQDGDAAADIRSLRDGEAPIEGAVQAA